MAPRQPPRPAVVQLKVQIPAELHRRLKVYAAHSGTPMNALVATALTALLKHRGAR